VVTGFPPGIVGGTVHAADAVATQAQRDLAIGYDDAASRPATATVSADLGGRTLAPGVYTAASALGLTGDLTLDAGGDPDAVFVLRAGSALTTASGSRVLLAGGAQACRVFWQVGSSATIGTSASFSGTILALTSIALTTDARLDGRALARNGAVTLDSNVITSSACTAPGTGTGSPGTPATGGAATPPAGTPAVGPAAPAPASPGPGAPTPGGPTGAATPGSGAPQRPSTAPVGVTLAPLAVGATSIRVEGLVQPGASGAGYRWEYGTTRRYGHHTPTTRGTPSSSARRVRGTIRGLRPCRTYHYRIAVRGSDGRWTYGRDRVARTTRCFPARLPRTPGGFAG
jgi:hypothetical protein